MFKQDYIWSSNRNLTFSNMYPAYNYPDLWGISPMRDVDLNLKFFIIHVYKLNTSKQAYK